MNLLFDGVGGPVLLLLSLFVVVTAVLWLLLPFSIFGIKAKLDEQLRVLRRIDAGLERLHGALAEPARRSPIAEPERTIPPDTATEMPLVTAIEEAEPGHEPRPLATQQRESDARWQKPDIPA